ncbi:MAG TPA: hypothetical protein VM870_08995 [Pyrinomonadaceae bacterium]|nr:hypothetical protein [Pyrinomonadaceae bacterium]
MSNEMTREPPDSRSFEERVFARFDAIDARLTKIETRLDKLEARVDSIDGRLQVLEAKAYDTKSVWERALAEILALSQKVDGIDRKLNVMNRDMLTLRADQERIEDRMDKLKSTTRQ